MIGIDVFTYRIIKERGMTVDELVAHKTLLIEGVEKENTILMSKLDSKDRRIEVLEDDNIRKDLAITNLVAINKNMADKTISGLDEIKKDMIKMKDKPFYLNGKFWGGVGVGIILGTVLANR